MAKGTTEYLQFGITPELKEKVNNFCSIQGNTKNQLFNDLLEEFFKNKIVANDFIKLDKPYYFNIQDLIKNKYVECTTDEPTHRFNEHYIINMVPNNLDSYNPDYKTFCNGSRLEHKGILINYFRSIKNINGGNYYYLLFEYALKDISNILNDNPILKISLIDPTEIIFNTDVVNNEDVLTQLQHQENEIKRAIKQNENLQYNLTDEFINKVIEDDKESEINITDYTDQIKTYNGILKLMLCYTKKGNGDSITEEYIKKCLEDDHDTEINIYNYTDEDNGKVFINPIVLKEWSNYYILRPYTIEHTLKTIINLCETNPEVKKYIETPPLNINLEEIRQYLQDFKFNVNVFRCYSHLKPSGSGFNLNNLLDMHKNKRTYGEQYTEDQKAYYRKLIIESIENTEHDHEPEI